jgi:DNA-binding response OmpR family regulator
MNRKPINQVLLIEDNPGDARLLKEMLNDQRAHGANLTWVASMREAERELSAREVDVILLDLGLPDAQGMDAVRRARLGPFGAAGRADGPRR